MGVVRGGQVVGSGLWCSSGELRLPGCLAFLCEVTWEYSILLLWLVT